MTTLGKKIQKLRKEKGWTQEELAGRVGVSAQAVSKWETDVSSPDISLLRPLAELLGVTVDQLLDLEEKEEGPMVRMTAPEKRKSLDELVLRMNVIEPKGDTVKFNLPMPLVKLGLEIGMSMPSMSNKEILQRIDLEKILALAETGVIGKLMEVKSADGDLVEIVVE